MRRAFSHLGGISDLVISPVKLRTRMRAQRNKLSDAERNRNAHGLTTVMLSYLCMSRVQRIAAYTPHDGEIDPGPLLMRLRKMGKRIYLPVVHGKRLWFLPDGDDTPHCSNRYGMPEPDVHARHRCLPWGLDLVLAPLVAVDSQGTRMGMGAGYYDRTFAFRANRSIWRRPLLIGAAHEIQRVEILPRQVWDIPLDALCTEKELIFFNNNFHNAS